MKRAPVGPVVDRETEQVVIYCDRDAAVFVAEELPAGDGFTRELWQAIAQLDKVIAEREEYEANAPRLYITMVRREH